MNSLENIINNSNYLLKLPVSETHQIILNTLNWAIDIVPIEMLQQEVHQELEFTLKERWYGLSVEEQKKAIHQLKEVAKKHSIHVPYWFYLLTTLNCNQKCTYCYEKEMVTNKPLDMKLYAKEIEYINQLEQERNIAQERMNIVLFGWEPLTIKPDDLKIILDGIKEKNRKTIIVTNWTTIDKHITNLIEYKDQISDFRISLDWPEVLHNQRRPYKNNEWSYQKMVENINLLLDNWFVVKLQTILWKGNLEALDDIVQDIREKWWFDKDNFQRRIEWSHDYKNLDKDSDEISEWKMVKKIVEIYQNNPDIQKKLIFESFKYLAHIVDSFSRLWNRKTYRWPKYGFCEPQKWFQYVFSTDGKIYHCPRTIDEKNYHLGSVDEPIQELSNTYKDTIVRDKENCWECNMNSFCWWGCVVQKKYHPNFDCKSYANWVIQEFIDLMKEEIMEKADKNDIVSINNLRQDWKK